MGDTIAIFNDLVVINQNLVSQCCCNITSGFVYWEAVPCQAYTTVGEYCEDINQCNFLNRKYVNAHTVCAGEDVLVCECQKIVTPDLTTLINNETGASDTAATWEINTGWSNASGIFSDTAFTTSVKKTATNIVYNRTFTYSDYTYLHQMVSAINSYSPDGTPFAFALSKLSASGIPDSFDTASPYVTAIPTTFDILSKRSEFFVRAYGVETNPIVFTYTSNPNVIAQTIQNELNAALGYSGIRAAYDSDAPYWYYLTYINELCGIEHSAATIRHRLVGEFSPPTDPYVELGEYQTGETWGTHAPASLYSIEGSGIYPCPLDYVGDEYEVPGLDGNYVSTQCCPQKGLTMGPLQNLEGTTEYGTNFENLENTAYINDGCYKLSPFFFLYGKTGRLYDHPVDDRTIFHLAHCNYANNECDNDLPCNCTPELFTTSFHKNAPWGPYGSYYSGVEDNTHPAYDAGLFGTNLMATQFRSGYYYYPSGIVRTVGSWTETTGILVQFRYYKPVPFYTGVEDPAFDDAIVGQIIASTVASGLTIAAGNTGFGETTLSFATSGKSVADFIGAINNIRIYSTGTNECELFAFCGAASNDVLSSIPANKITNMSSELFDVWKQIGNQNASYLVSDPDQDMYGYSASTIWAAVKPYPDMFVENGIMPNNFNSTLITREASTPPPCRRTHNLPKSATYDYLPLSDRFSPRPFWTAMQGCEATILNVAKYTGGNFDPHAQSMSVEMSGRILYVTVSSGSTILASSGISSIRNGSGYTHEQYADAINAATLTWFGVPASSYRPLIATSGDINDYHIYVDDATWVDGGLPSDYGVGARTTSNYGFVEPLFDTLSVDLFNGGTLALNTWVRRRCNWTNDGGTTQHDLFLNPCVPPDADRFEPSIDLECEADNIISGNWLLAYGCGSSVCKTEYYIQAQRCGCDTMFACSEDGSQPVAEAHPFNKNIPSDCANLTQPTLYMCRSNIHPDCDIPFLVKVPAQFVCELDEDGNSVNNDCAFGQGCDSMYVCGDPRCPQYTDLPRSSQRVGYYLPDWSCVHGQTQWEWMNLGYDGWCQYIDPTNLVVVPKASIPRTYPPTALVMERTSTPFCTTYINATDEGAGDTKYDSIRPLWPWVPPEYLVPITGDHPGWPCFLNHLFANPLFAYVRPMVAELNGSDVCGTCGRADIDCNTRCCGCGFYCENGGDPCNNEEIGPVRNCSHTETLVVEQIENSYFACCYELRPEDCGNNQYCNNGGNGCFPPAFVYRDCLDGTVNIVTTINFTQTRSDTHRLGFTLFNGNCVEVTSNIGCCWGATGDQVTTETYGGCAANRCYPCCGAAPDCHCSDVDYGDCTHITTTPVECGTNVAAYILELTPGTTTTIEGCTNCTPGNFSETITTNTYSDTLNDCGVGTLSYSQDITQVYEGDSTIDHSCGLAGTLALGIGYTGFTEPYEDMACTNWTSDKDGNWLLRDTFINTSEGTATFGATTCSNCNFNAGVSPKTYDYINAFELHWACGLPNYFGVAASGSGANGWYNWSI